jgi:hypothetical protein
MSDAPDTWLAWSCKIAAPRAAAAELEPKADARLRRVVARAFQRIVGVQAEVLISGFGDERELAPKRRRRAREPSSPPAAKRAAQQTELFEP